MAEELVLEVKTNLGKATKETKDWGKALDDVNEEIAIQNEEIIRQERLLIKLKAKQDAIPKGGWVAGMDKLNDKIRKTSELINLEKNTLKDLTNQQKQATKEVKKTTVAKKEDNTVTKESVANFQFMGVSLNGIKKGFSQIIPTAKAMFGTIKAGIISTGIGALVLAVIALTQSFKRSEEGQEKFQRIMAGIGAVTSQVLDLFAGLGETIIDAVTSPMKALESFKDGVVKFLKNPIGTIKDVATKTANAVKTLVDETKKEVDALVEVTKARQKAHHIDRKLKVERAKANREINDIRLKAEDRENQSATDRIALLRKAQAIEEGITAKEIQSKKILIEAQKLEMAQGKNSKADKDKLAQLQADLINLDTKKLRSQRLLQTQITTAVNEEKAIKEKAVADAQKIIDDELAAKIKAAEDWEKQRSVFEDEEVKAAKKAAEEEIRIAKEVADAKAKIRDANIANIESGIGLVKSLAGKNKDIQAAAIIAENAVGIAKTIIATQTANAGALATPQAIASSGALAIPVIAANNIAAALSIATSVAATAQGLSALGAGGGGGGGGNLPSAPSASSAPPAPQMMSGAFELTGGQPVEPLQAYVVSDDITDSQNGLAIIRRRATI